MNKIIGILLTIVAGLFFLIGGLISLKVKDKEKLNHFSVALALVIMIGLMFWDLTPEIIELLEGVSYIKSILIVTISLIIGFSILKVLDLFIPNHHHNHHEINDNKKEHDSHIKHIGTLTIISLILHNILEGFAILGMTINNFKIGLLITISVALHNIPLGTHIFSTTNIKKNKLLISVLTLSSLVGGLIFMIFKDINHLILSIVTSITLGMIFYIIICELLPEVLTNIKNKETRYGIFIGIIVIFLSMFI